MRLPCLDQPVGDVCSGRIAHHDVLLVHEGIILGEPAQHTGMTSLGGVSQHGLEVREVRVEWSSLRSRWRQLWERRMISLSAHSAAIPYK